MKFCWAALVCCIGYVDIALGQESVTQETSPPGMKWYQINTDNFRVLYPKGFDKEAQRVANTLEHIREPEAATLGVSPKKISIVLHSQSSISNGFVTAAPRRSEFFAMPPQNYNFIGTNEWLTLLASHEYRHIAQFQKSITGFNRAIYLLFGQLAQAGMAFITVPQWFWEGDATATETAFTASGRGRIPEFDLVFRTNFLEGRNFNYNKQYLRSFKHNVPNHYVLGYHMVSYLRKRTGNPNIWADITKRAWDVPFIPFAFSSAIKKETGMYVTDLYKEMAKEVKTEWIAQQKDLELTAFKSINKRSSKTYTDYSYPQPLADGSIVALKSGIGDISQLVTITPDGEEKRRFVPGPINDAGMLSAANGNVVWNEFRIDPRWHTRSYIGIKSYNLKANKRKVLTKGTRYAASALSPDGSNVVTVETDDAYKTRLVVLNFASGKPIKNFQNANNNLISMPRWSQDGKYIVFIQRQDSGKVISRIEYRTDAVEDLYEAGEENVGHPVLFENYLFFSSPISGIDNIYAMDISSGMRYQVTSSKYGAYSPAISFDGKKIFYNDQTANGLDIVQTDFAPATWKLMSEVKSAPSLYANILSEQEGKPGLMGSIPTKKYPTSRYHRVSGIINPHSWGPYFLNSVELVNLGITSRDVLSTTEISGGYTYDIADQSGGWRAGVSYGGQYPIVDAEFTFSDREVSERIFGRDVRFKWREIGGSAGLRVPLLLTRSKYNRSLTVGNSIGYSSVSGFRNTVSENGTTISSGFGRLVPANDTLSFNFTEKASNGNLLFNRFTLTFNNQLKTSRRDFNPKFGQSLAVEAFNTPYGGTFEGWLYVVRGTLFFPGLLKHHSLWFRGGYQERFSDTSLDVYTFKNRLTKPRGYSYPLDSRFHTISTNYELPIWYPDLSLGPVLNIQRIKANLFYDYGEGEGLQYFYRFDPGAPTAIYNANSAAMYQSLGVELTFDLNIMRFLPLLEVGLRTSYISSNRFSNSGAVFEFLIGNIPL